jgi:hypothetical protein
VPLRRAPSFAGPIAVVISKHERHVLALIHPENAVDTRRRRPDPRCRAQPPRATSSVVVLHKLRSWPPSRAPRRLLMPPLELYARAHRPPTDAARLPHRHGRAPR